MNYEILFKQRFINLLQVIKHIIRHIGFCFIKASHHHALLYPPYNLHNASLHKKSPHHFLE